MSRRIQKIVSLKVFELKCDSFRSINSNSLSRKKHHPPLLVSNYHLTPCKQVSTQNTLVGIELIELTERDLLDYRQFFKHCKKITNFKHYKLFYTYFCLFLCGAKSFVLKTNLYFNFFWLVWVCIRCYSIKGSVFLVSLL